VTYFDMRWIWRRLVIHTSSKRRTGQCLPGKNFWQTKIKFRYRSPTRFALGMTRMQIPDALCAGDDADADPRRALRWG
jgi:hypothetical protein